MLRDADIPDKKTIEAVAASTLSWVVGVVAHLIEAIAKVGSRSRTVRGVLSVCLSEAFYYFKLAIALFAAARLSYYPRRAPAPRPVGGFRVRRRRSSMIRIATRSALGRGPRGFHARLTRLRAMLDDIDACVARMMRRFLRGFSFDARVLAAPPRVRVAPTAPPLVAAHADTS